jgi:probable HAF family extracellular repeat protein
MSVARVHLDACFGAAPVLELGRACLRWRFDCSRRNQERRVELASEGESVTNRNVILGLCAILLTIVSLAPAAEEPAGGVSDFKNINAPGATETDPYAINNQGFIAGDYVDSSGVQHGMILHGKTLTTVDHKNCLTTPGNNAIAFYGINSKETVVGWCQNNKTGVNNAFSYSKGKFVNISPPGSVSTQAQGINDKGQIVGTYLDTGGNQHGFLRTSGKYTTLDVPGDTASDAWAINNKGLITIFAANTSGSYDSFLFNGKSYTEIDVPGATQNFVAAIDNFGDRVYTILDSSNNIHGAFFLNVKGGTYTVFDDPKGTDTTHAFGLNNSLKIVGRYSPASRDGAGTATSQGYSAIGCCRGVPTDHPPSH